jgi:hypothetical protein
MMTPSFEVMAASRTTTTLHRALDENTYFKKEDKSTKTGNFNTINIRDENYFKTPQSSKKFKLAKTQVLTQSAS